MRLFSDGDNLKKIGNKSGFLAGIMRRYNKEVVGAPSTHNTQGQGTQGGSSTSSSSSATIRGGADSEATLGKLSGAVTKAEGVDLSRPETEADEEEGDSDEEGDGEGEGAGGGEGAASTVLSRRDRKKQEAAELQQLLEEVMIPP